MSSNSAHPTLVSVYLPTRDRYSKLRQAVDSVLQQTYAPVELLIIDDGSKEDTPQWLLSLAAQGTLRYWKFKSPQGAPACRNFAIQAARGQFVTGLDDDDIWLPDRLQLLIDNFVPEVAFVCTADIMRVRGNTGMHIRKPPAEITLEKLLHRNVAGNQVFTLRERLIELDAFDETLVAAQDYDLWIRLVRKYGRARGVPLASQIVDDRHEEARISTSSAAYKGRRRVFLRYRHLMSPQCKKSHLCSVLRMRPTSNTRHILALCFVQGNRIRTLIHIARNSLPHLSKAIDFLGTVWFYFSVRTALQRTPSRTTPNLQ